MDPPTTTSITTHYHNKMKVGYSIRTPSQSSLAVCKLFIAQINTLGFFFSLLPLTRLGYSPSSIFLDISGINSYYYTHCTVHDVYRTYFSSDTFKFVATDSSQSVPE